MKSSNKMDSAALRRLLRELGYTIHFRGDVWVECLLRYRHERWLGLGVDEREAFEAATRKALPSQMARALFARWAHEDEARLALDGPAGGSGPSDARRPQEEVGAARTNGPMGDTATPATASATAPTATTAQTPLFHDEPIYDRAEALGALGVLSDRIEDERLELGMMTPRRQRMVILSWICGARVWEDRRPDDAFVARQVAAIARKLTWLGKVWWPGSVRSLHARSTPADAVSEAGVNLRRWEGRGPLGAAHDTPAPVRSWETAAELVGDQLQALLARDARLGRDAYGWADAEALEPAPRDPDGVLAGVARTLTAATGPLGEPARVAAREAVLSGAVTAAELGRWAALLRWVRGSATDLETWGAALGRVRWLALQLPGDKSGRVSELLDSDHQPRAPWAVEVGATAAERGDHAGHGLEALAARLSEQARSERAGGEVARILLVAPQAAAEERAEGLARALGLEFQARTLEALDEAALEEIARGDFDAVVGVLRFGAHEADRAVARACRRGNVAHARVFAAHAVSVARALERRLR